MKVLLTYSLTWIQKSTKKAIQGESSSEKLTDHFIEPGSKAEDAVSTAEGAFSFHTI